MACTELICNDMHNRPWHNVRWLSHEPYCVPNIKEDAL